MSEAREDLAALEKVRSSRVACVYCFADPLFCYRTTRRSLSRPTTVKRTWNTRLPCPSGRADEHRIPQLGCH
jgi:hypothetical protein